MKQRVVAGLDRYRFYNLHIEVYLQTIATTFLLVKHKVSGIFFSFFIAKNSYLGPNSYTALQINLLMFHTLIL
jgi:hypothetical protein